MFQKSCAKKQKTLQALEKQKQEESIAEKFNVSVSSVNQWIKILKERDLIQQSEEDHDYGTIYVNRNECLFSCNRITKYGLSPEDWCKLNEMEEIKEI